MTTVDRILELVNESGTTAKEFAEGAGLAGGSITDWKTGRSKPSVESLQKIAKYANVQLAWLTGDTEFRTIDDLFKEYNKNLYKFDINTTLSMALLRSLANKDKNYIEHMDDIKNFLVKKKNVFDIKESDIENFSKKYMVAKRKNIKKTLTEIVSELKDAQENRNTYAVVASSIIDDKLNAHYYMCPVYGRISAGIPNWAEECMEGTLPIDPELMGILNPEEHFFLKVNGESMNKIVKNGAFALIHKQDIVENGEIAVVLVNGYDATLKKFTKQGDLVILEPQSNDESFETQVYDKTTSIKVLGKYVGKMEFNN